MCGSWGSTFLKVAAVGALVAAFSSSSAASELGVPFGWYFFIILCCLCLCKERDDGLQGKWKKPELEVPFGAQREGKEHDDGGPLKGCDAPLHFEKGDPGKWKKPELEIPFGAQREGKEHDLKGCDAPLHFEEGDPEWQARQREKTKELHQKRKQEEEEEERRMEEYREIGMRLKEYPEEDVIKARKLVSSFIRAAEEVEERIEEAAEKGGLTELILMVIRNRLDLARRDGKWKKPDYGWWKLNVAGTCEPHNGPSAACGGVLRDSSGKWLLGFSMKLDPTCELHETELHAMLTGLKLASKMNVNKLHVESHYESVANMEDNSLGSNTQRPEYGIVQDIIELRHDHAWRVEVNWVPETANRLAYWLAKDAHNLSSYNVPHKYYDIHFAPHGCFQIWSEDNEGS